jgi:hypothetical protein
MGGRNGSSVEAATKHALVHSGTPAGAGIDTAACVGGSIAGVAHSASQSVLSDRVGQHGHFDACSACAFEAWQ